MKIYDCFTFYNEFDLLAIRLAELYTKVDRFVIVESNQTFTNNAKPWNFDIANYPEYADKITYIQVDDMPNSINPWVNENHQRNSILRGIVDAEPDDIIIISDCDEIPRPEAIDKMRGSEQTIFALRMPLYNFKFNYMRVHPGEYDVWAMAARKTVFDEIDPNTLRGLRFNFFGSPYQYSNEGCELVEHAGWHFGYLGNKEMLIDKAQNFSHQEVNRPDFIAQIDVEASIKEGKEWDRSSTNQYKIVEFDNYFPKQMQTAKYQNWVLANPVANALDFLPPYPYN